MQNDPRSTRRWKTLRLAILERDGYTCSVCGGEADQVDHIIPITAGGAVFDEENLVAMCAKHNRQKSNNTTGQLTDWINPVWLAWETEQLGVTL